MIQSSDGFKIVIGETWRAPSSQASSPIAGSVDFGRIRDVFDIVVDGASIVGRTDEDSIFFLIRDLLFAVEKLGEGNRTARVSFYDGPWELVLQRLGSKVCITFYRGGHRPEVAIKDRVVQFDHLTEGVLASATELIRQAKKIDECAVNDPLIVGMTNLCERISKADFTEVKNKETIPEPVSISSTRWKKPRTETSFSFGFKFKATATDLLSKAKPNGSDLNALFFKGQIAVHARGRRLVLGKSFLFLQAERLLASLRQLLTAWEEGRPMSSRLISDGLVVGVRLGRDDGLVVSLMDSSREDALVVLNDLTPWEYGDAVLGVAREVRRLIVDVNPAQRRNLRLESFSREIKSLSIWAKEQRRGAIINEDVEPYRRLVEPKRVSDSPFSISDASRLGYCERWRVEVEGLDLNGTMLCDGMALVSARGLMLGVEVESGAVAWRREIDRSDARVQRAGNDSIVRAAPSGHIEMIDLETGVLRWRTILAPRSGGAPVLLLIEQGPAPGLVIAVEEDRKLVALDIRTGEQRWRFATSRGGRFSLRRYGRLLYVASNDSHFNAIDIEDGSLVWRFTDRTQFLTPPAVSDDTVLVLGGRPGRPEGRMYALDAFSGEQRWSVPTGGGAMTAPIIAKGTALVPIRLGQKNELVGIRVSTGEILWRRDCAGWADPCALMALDDNFIINSAGGMIRSLGAKDGQEQWTSVLGPTCSDDIPLGLRIELRGGALFVPADTVYVVHPKDGRVIHSLGGDPPVPDLLQVDRSGSVFIAEDSGHIAMYSLTNRLSVVS